MGKVTVEQAAKLLKEGAPVALPTETVYGLAAPINSASSIKKIFEIKKRPFNDPLIVHVSNLDMAQKLFKNTYPELTKLSQHFWPGPLTVVGKKASDVSHLITSGLDTVAVRIPNSPLFRKVIELVGAPLAAPSANMFKKVSPTTAEHVLHSLPGISVLDGGPCEVGIESTIYDLERSIILRPGQITHQEIESVLQRGVTYFEEAHTPGSETDHYQPQTPVYVFEEKSDLIEFARKSNTTELLLDEEPQKSAACFYSNLRKLDGQADYILIYYNKEWTKPEWLGIKNRILKSSSKWMD